MHGIPGRSKHARRQLSALLVLLLILLGGSVTVAAETTPDSTLARIDMRQPDDLHTIAGLGIPVYAHLVDAAGQEYVFALVEPEVEKSLAESGLSVQALGRGGREEAYYLISPRPGQGMDAAQDYVEFLTGDEGQAIVRAIPSQAEQLPSLGFEIARLGPNPIAASASLARTYETNEIVLPSAITPNPAIAQMIAQVNAEMLMDYTKKLSGATAAIIGGEPYSILNRNTYGGTPIRKATQYVYEHFSRYGLVPNYHYWYDSTNPNVTGTIQGQGSPDRFFLLTAHLDNMPTNSIAPGADDNASGVAAMMAAASILSPYDWDCSLRFVAFTGEEQGLLGSRAYVQSAYNLRDNIDGVLNLDMIGYNSDSYPIVDLHVKSSVPGSEGIANLFVEVVKAYQINLTPHILYNPPAGLYSDHKSFWDYNYPAIMVIEDWYDFTPYYHRISDRWDTLNYTYFTNITRAAIATFAHLGCLAPRGYLAGQITAASGGEPIPDLEVNAANGSYNKSANTGSDGKYRLNLPPGSYTVKIEAPGYMPYSSGVSISENLTTTLNASLAITPTYTISGAVNDTLTGQPVYARVTVEGPGRTAVYTDPQNGRYTLRAFQGSYDLQIESPHHLPQSRPVTLDHDQQQDFELEPYCLLVVDYDGGRDYEAYYTGALSRLEEAYRTLAYLPDLASLAFYRGVIWLTGDRSINTLTALDQAKLSAYLDAGGRLFISGQGTGKDIGSSDFYRDYLHAEYLTDEAADKPLTGVDFLAHIGPISIAGGDGANNQVSPGAVAPYGDAAGVFRYQDSPSYGGVAYSGLHRSIYFSFGYEAISERQKRDDVMEAVLDFMGSCQAPDPPQASFSAQATGEPGGYRFTNDSRGTPWLSYTWDFGDGSAPSDDANPLHWYPEQKIYAAVLTAANAYGEASFSLEIDTHSECVPLGEPSIIYSPAEPRMNEAVTFTAVIPSGTVPVEYEWDFGDGEPQERGINLRTIQNTFSEAGDYDIKLVVSHDCTDKQFAGTKIVVIPHRLYLPHISRQP